jgi:hypothetical protein
MKTQNTELELRKERRELANFLGQVSPVANGHQLNELLADMNREDALGFHKVRGTRKRVWYPLNPDAYFLRVSQMEPNVPATFADMFLRGQLEFYARTKPALKIQWCTVPMPDE